MLEEVGKLTFKEMEEPRPKKDEVIVRVKNCGICGSDIPRVYQDGAHRMPLIIGHEFSGVAELEGSGVSGKWTGKKVGVYPLIPCRQCRPCLSGHYEMCRSYSYLGSRRDGGFAEYVAVPEWNLIEIPETVSCEQAAMLEPMSVAAHAVRRFDIPEDAKIAIYGQGTIGLFILMLLLAQENKNIFVFGNHDLQREKALELGLPREHFCDIRKEAVREWVDERTAGEGFDTVFEAVGSEATYAQAVELSAPGGKLCLIGNPQKDMGLKRDIYWKILRNQLTIAGTWNSSFGADSDDWHYILKLLEEKKITPEKLISHRYPLENIREGFQMMRDKKEDYIKIMTAT